MPTYPTERQLLGMTDEELAGIDCALMNLIVAKGLPALSHIDIARYLNVVDGWGRDLLQRMPALELQFQQTPEQWDHDLAYFRLGLVCWYADVVQELAYREDHIEQQKRTGRMEYSDPNDVFLTGLLD